MHMIQLFMVDGSGWTSTSGSKWTLLNMITLVATLLSENVRLSSVKVIEIGNNYRNCKSKAKLTLIALIHVGIFKQPKIPTS